VKARNVVKAAVGAAMLLFGIFLSEYTGWQWVPIPTIPGGRMLMDEPVLLYTIFGLWLYLSWFV
jgi:hypothetical protein